MYSKLQNKTTLFSTVRIQMQNIFRLLKMKMHTFIKQAHYHIQTNARNYSNNIMHIATHN